MANFQDNLGLINNNNKSVMLKIYAATTTRYVGSTLPLEVQALKLLECQWHVYAEYICSSI